MTSTSPLYGLRVVELAGLAPVPFAGLILSDYGASVLRVDRPHPSAHTKNAPPPTIDPLTRNKSSIALDLKASGGVALLKALLHHADILLDPFRPGVLESLGLIPAELQKVNERLIIARLTGFRRDGKYRMMAGHDINYLAVAGVLSQLGQKDEPPHPPANLLGDFAGGGLTCAFGILLALQARHKTGRGQIVECNMVDSVAYLGTPMRIDQTPLWSRPRGENLLDGGCPYYNVYECKDGGYMAVGAIEPKFFKELLKGLGLRPELIRVQEDRSRWPFWKETFTKTFKQKSRREWERIFEGKDACCTPVFSQQELAREMYDQRPLVGLTETPARALEQSQLQRSDGLAPGINGERILEDWAGWQRGRDYGVLEGGLVKIDCAKL